MRRPMLKPSSARLPALLLAIVLFLFGGVGGRTAPGSAQAQATSVASVANACPNTPASPPGPDFRNRDLSGMNFNRLDLRNANFSGATLKGTVFIGANLSGADFSNARVLRSDNEDLRPTDFTGANLRQACLAGMSFTGRTYFSHADVSCADFSNTVLQDGLTIFGPGPLVIDASLCKPAFRGTTMNCEFISDWSKLDFKPSAGSSSGAGANLSACAAKLAGVALPNLDLTGANLQNANLSGANLYKATLRGANLNHANLSGADLTGAILSGEPGGPATTLIGAHLHNTNLTSAQLAGADFSYANFYSNGHGPCGIGKAGKSCASASGATMTGTRFTGAFLYGVDFSNATISGVDFSYAVLTGANFAGATINNNGETSPTTFLQAHLEGTNLGQSQLIRDASLANAYVDFNRAGNTLNVELDGNHTQHACPSSGCPVARGASVCISMSYGGEGRVPQAEPSLTCPSGDQLPAGCGPAERDGSNPAWKSTQPLNAPPAWYGNAATYTPAAPSASICNGATPRPVALDW
ncbi:pentapeptide repeat-containing protein [Noviherbaspirillum pedocola]|uniref:Pentapeptide repeat-containing protein n=1 Tax=Noviherbaspirillum pedocola TaxID=2801341 RepID=A0A934W3K0_9BURK|nr:pentapeptide repeat-containing protein [Noviherbaspirillum pedocola]MBK4737516.1 pentapeptide repeat-containing protein [Noviherbaspirillum pedocola]